MRRLDARERKLAEVTAVLIARAEEIGLPDPLASPQGIRLLARAYLELHSQILALHDRVDQTDPSDPIGTALTEAGLERRPADLPVPGAPRLVPAPVDVAHLDADQLLARYLRVMGDVEGSFASHETFVVRLWDGMDGCWTDCTGEVGRDEALRVWAEKTDGGTRCVSFSEIDYYRIFPGGTRMLWDGSDKREMHQ